jgi:hypothetical protein
MRKMMMIVTAVFSLAGCAVDPAEEAIPAADEMAPTQVISDLEAEEGENDAAVTPSALEDSEVEVGRCTRSGTCEVETGEDQGSSPKGPLEQPAVDEVIAPFEPKLCYWHSECPSNVCDLTTRTCRDYPF